MATKLPNREMFIRITRLHRIFDWRYRSGKGGSGLTYSQLAEALGNDGLGTAGAVPPSERTLRRDLKFMQKGLGLPLVNERGGNGGWRYKSESFTDLPLLQISLEDAMALRAARDALEHLAGSAFSERLDLLLKRLFVQEDAEAADLFGDRIEFKSMGSSVEPSPHFALIADAVLHCRPLRIDYRKSDDTRRASLVVQPYLLQCYREQWYVIVRYADSTGMLPKVNEGYRRLRVSRILGAVCVPGGSFRRDPDFKASQLANATFGVFAGDEVHQVVIEFNPHGAKSVRGRRWHFDQRFEELPDGSLRLHLRVDSLVELTSWVLGFGPDAVVIEPPQLVDAVGKRLRAAVARYSS